MQGPKWPLFYSHIDPVWSLLIIGTGCALGRAPRTKETLPDFRELSGNPTSTSILRVDGLSTDPPVLGRHRIPLGSLLVYLHGFEWNFGHFLASFLVLSTTHSKSPSLPLTQSHYKNKQLLGLAITIYMHCFYISMLYATLM